MNLFNYESISNINSISIRRITFILLCLLLISLDILILNYFVTLFFVEGIGFIKIDLIIISCSISAFFGSLYYIIKHDIAHGNVYRLYQVVNSSFFGIKNYLISLLIIIIIKLVWVPIVNFLIIIIFIYFIKKYVKGVIWKI